MFLRSNIFRIEPGKLDKEGLPKVSCFFNTLILFSYRFDRKKIFMRFLFTILVFSSFIFPGAEVRAQFSFGPLLGIQISGTAGGEGFTNYDYDYGWKAGGMAYIPIGKKYFLNPEVIIDAKSYKYNFISAYPVNNEIIPAYVYERLTFGYIESPISIQRKFSSGFHIGGGVFAAYQISQRRDETVTYTVEVNSMVTVVTSTSFTREITADRFQCGIQAAVGYIKSGFDLSLESQYHLTPLYNFAGDDPGKLHFLNLTLALSYHFNLSRKTDTR